MLRHVTRTSIRVSGTQLRCLSTKKNKPRNKSSQPRLYDHMMVTEGRSWVTMVPRKIGQDPRTRSRNLRLAGNARAAHLVLKQAGLMRSRDEADLIECLLVLLHTDEFKGPRERLETMMKVLKNAPTTKPKVAFNILLTACAKDAGRVSDNSSVKRGVILKTAEEVWNEVRHFSKIDPKNTALLYRVCGDCKDMELARKVRAHANDPVLFAGKEDEEDNLARSSEDATAAYILCLGKCGRSAEAEQLYFSGVSRTHRSSDKVLSALFRAYVASNRISKAEALIAMYGSGFLDGQSCNAFVKQCAALRMHESAFEFVGRMSRSAETGFPKPNARTYNLLLRGLSAGTGSEDRGVAADRALVVIEQMKAEGIQPTTVTYNTMIRSLVFRDQNREALELYRAMESPNRITFSHLMQGAANCRDMELAEGIFDSLVQAKERPNYGFCKSYLETVAKVRGVDAAFSESVRLSERFGEVLVFGDVGSHEAVRMALINACGKVGNLNKAFDALHLKLATHNNEVGDLAPLYVATVLMQVCLECHAPGRALEVFHSLKAAGLQPNFEVYESLIYGLSSYVRAELSKQTTAEAHEEEIEADGDWESDAADVRDDAFAEAINASPSIAKRRENKTSSPFNANSSQNEGNGTDLLTPEEALRTAVQVLREMHQRREGRPIRQAAYMYNTLIAAAASAGDFELALQIFNKMSRRNNPGVVYFSKDETRPTQRASIGGTTGTSEDRTRGQAGLAALVSTGMFESEFEFPAATVGTYNSMIDAAWKCGEPWFSFRVFEMMQMDRITEPNAATLSLLTDIALADGEAVAVEKQQALLKEMDGVAILPEEVCRKRVRLRQKLLALRWC